MSTSYTGLGTTINVRAAGTTTTVGFNTNVVLVGGYNADEGSATAGEVEYIDSDITANDLFGEDSELATQRQLSSMNGAGGTYAVAVPEESDSEEFTDASSATLENSPIFDPTVQPEHEITITDTSDDTDIEYEISYEDTLPTPDSGAVVNPVVGEIEFATTGTYEIEYDYGDYDTAINAAASENVRFVKVLTEATSVKNTLASALNDEATDIRFKRGVVGATPSIDSGGISDYEPDLDDQRVIEVAPARGDTGDGQTRTVGAVGGAFSAQPLGQSLTYESISGFESLNEAYRPSQAMDFEGVTAITDSLEVVEGVTTASENAFSDVYKVEIIDTVVQGLYQVGREYAGGPNTEDDRANLRSDSRNLLSGYASQRPPLLSSADGSNPYSVEVELGSSDDQTIMNVGIDPLDVMKEVVINLNVGTVVTYEGAAVA